MGKQQRTGENKTIWRNSRWGGVEIETRKKKRSGKNEKKKVTDRRKRH